MQLIDKNSEERFFESIYRRNVRCRQDSKAKQMFAYSCLFSAESSPFNKYASQIDLCVMESFEEKG